LVAGYLSVECKEQYVHCTCTQRKHNTVVSNILPTSYRLSGTALQNDPQKGGLVVINNVRRKTTAYEAPGRTQEEPLSTAGKPFHVTILQQGLHID
jgi:hypothetical protein